jgi:hypothetical protein
MKLNRDELEQQARMTVSAELYYDLVDTIDSVTDDELYKIIACNGSYRLEVEL